MPSAAHEVPLQILQENPAILIELLRKLGRPAPEGPLVPDDANLRFANPTEVPESLREGASHAILVEGRRETLLAMLDRRRFVVSDEARATIDACTDPALLEQWILQAAEAASVDEALRVP